MFWRDVKTATRLINEIERDRSRDTGLSAAIRVYVVEFLPGAGEKLLRR